MFVQALNPFCKNLNPILVSGKLEAGVFFLCICFRNYWILEEDYGNSHCGETGSVVSLQCWNCSFDSPASSFDPWPWSSICLGVTKKKKKKRKKK